MTEPAYSIGIYTRVITDRDPLPTEHWTPVAYAHDHISAERVAKGLSSIENIAYSVRIGQEKPYVWYRNSNRYDY